MTPSTDRSELKLRLAVDLIAAYVMGNRVPASELPALIRSIHASVDDIDGPVIDVASPHPRQVVYPVTEPAVPIGLSVTDDYIVCLENGKKFKSLKRHLRTEYDMSPEEYRAKWGLPHDYPMTAPAYAARRSEIAKQFGLGRRRIQ